MSDKGAITQREDSPLSAQGDLERYRNSARGLELEVKRKEAELMQAKEEQTLLKELRTVNEMIIQKKKRQESEGEVSGLKISPESLSELNALEDQLKIEDRKTQELQRAAKLTANEAGEVERALEDTERQLAEAKRATGWEENRNAARTEVAATSEFREKQMSLDVLNRDQGTMEEILTRQEVRIAELQKELEAASEMDAHFAESERELRELNAKYTQMVEEKKSSERIQKKKERELQNINTGDRYKGIRQLEGDKKVLHNNLSKLRETNVSNSKSILSLEVRLRYLENRLEAVNGFLKDVFAEVEDDDPVEGISSDDTEVSLIKFEEMCAELELLRKTVAQRDNELDAHDCKIEQLERKVGILQGAVASREVSSQVQMRAKQKEVADLMTSHDREMRQLESMKSRLSVENANLRHRLQQV